MDRTAAASGASAPPAVTVLLPSRERLAGAAPVFERMLARGDRARSGEGDEAQVLRAFDLLPRGLPIAALTRQYDCGDAAHHAWLRADPANVRADLGAGRLLACGDLGLTGGEVEALLQPLKPLFGDDGCPISAGAPSRWYLMLPRDSRLPPFAPPGRALGDDIYEHLPAGDSGRRWRRLLSEAQVILHNHPLNAERAAAGKPTVNSLWFWGAGSLPDHVRCQAGRVYSDDLLFAALAQAAQVAAHEVPSSFAATAAEPGTLVDLRRWRSAATFERDWLLPALAQARRARQPLRLDFADGLLVDYRHAHRWRFWRRAPAPKPAA
jgi:hypothetical protein